MLKKYNGKVNLIIKHYPLRSHKFARISSIAVLAADRQGKYKELTDLFYKKKKLNDATIKQYAQETGLDMEKFEKDLKDPAFQKLITEDVKLSQKCKVRGVPALFVNGRLSKERSIEGLSILIDKELIRMNP